MLASFKQKLLSFDHDIRYMAISDLNNGLEEDKLTLEPDSEKQYLTLILERLEDSSSDVRSLSVKILKNFIPHLNHTLVKEALSHSLKKLLSEESENKDIYNMAIFSIISGIAEDRLDVLDFIAKTTIPKLLIGIRSAESNEDKLVSIDIIRELIVKFNKSLQTDHSSIQKLLLEHLRFSAPKRAIECLSQLTFVVGDKLFEDTIEKLIDKLINEKEIKWIQVYIKTLTTITNGVGTRFGKFLNRLIPLIVKFCQEKAYEEQDDLRENCLQALESFLYKFPKEVSQYLETFLQIFSKLIHYDPNLIVDNSQSESFESESGSESPGFSSDKDIDRDNEYLDDDSVGDEDDSENDYSDYDVVDNDDLSWKVRRASVKCFLALIRTNPRQVVKHFVNIFTLLISCFKEHDSNVKSQIFETFSELLEQIKLMNINYSENPKIQDIVQNNTEKIMRLLQVQILNKDKNNKNENIVSCLKITSLLFELFPHINEPFLDKIMEGILFTLEEKNNSNTDITMEALHCLKIVISKGERELIFNYLEKIFTKVGNSIKSQFQRISVEGLQIFNKLALKIPKNSINNTQKEEEEEEENAINIEDDDDEDEDDDENDIENTWKKYGIKLHSITLNVLRSKNTDPVVKESSIVVLGTIISKFGNILTKDLPETFELLYERLVNEITRLTTLKSFRIIAISKLDFSMKSIINKLITQLITLLRQKKREFRSWSLRTLTSIFKHHSNEITENVFDELFSEMEKLIVDQDMHLSHITIRCVYTILEHNRNTIDLILEKILPKVHILIQSPLFQGIPAQTTLKFFEYLMNYDPNYLPFEKLKNPLYEIIENQNDKSLLVPQFFISIAKVLATLIFNIPEELSNQEIINLSKQIDHKEEKYSLFAIYAIGEIGKLKDLSTHKDLQKLLLSCFENESNLVKAAASSSFGNISSGNIIFFLPFVIKTIQESTKHQYLTFRSLKEIITNIDPENPQSIKKIENHIDIILELLFNNCENENEGTRKVVSECLGKFSLLDPKKFIPKLKDKLETQSPIVKQTIISAVKFMIHKDKTAADPILKEYIEYFLLGLRDENYKVRLAALVTLNFTLNTKPTILKKVINKFLPNLYEETKVKKDLVQIVKIGQLENVIDKGLENRKSAFDTMIILLRNSYELLNLSRFIEVIINGLSDINHEVIIQINNLILKLLQKNKQIIKTHIDQFSEGYKKNPLKVRPKSDVRRDQQIHEEMAYSSLKVIFQISQFAESAKSNSFNHLMQNVIRNDEFMNNKFTLLESNFDENSFEVDWSLNEFNEPSLQSYY
ncbi:tip120 [Anaeramoeba flamelloides]|uniref:Tip120 n=1 Tax=Anaeramoeba flamelloides TaxID=1746091 RepID=A0AAV7YFV5_9EUKA|nr:tip120 [Anaeramoeba flamelloides]